MFLPPSLQTLPLGGHAGQIEKIPNDILSSGQQFSSQAKHNLGQTLPSLSESLHGFQEHP